MDELAQIKSYLRIDEDLVEDDELLKALVEAGKRYITTATGKAYKDNDAVMRLCLTLFVAHQYNDRTMVSKNNVQEYSHSLSDILKHIESSDDYEKVAK
ncbi:phage related protein (plasmid) [Selenomonas ruminantium subsp. lactilytica TAM6421]|uniref:Phage related protein n=1 Tax=Selenomonas ruminantium subsp. lactilytica (strain NBRC 103574 / TAM6421) TaxID=927704 RepID=I0GWR1_SELRL|nr:head-tail connector protein [Selenomonas ruminantium]BAL85198.1 phage related protein [Selenomonas ruminantium subsp. lactilytica TAM6421]